MTKIPDPHKHHKSASSTSHPKRRTARTCGSRSCMKNPYFGLPGGRAIFCVAHKETGMVDVKNKRCEGAGCSKRRLFGFSWEKARFCSGHRLHGMVDLQNKRCKWAGCPKQASFAPPDKTVAAFCSAHRSPEMIDVKNPRCETDQCGRVASYGVDGQAPVACLLHRRAHMVELKQRRNRRTPSTDAPNSGRKTRGVDASVEFSGGGDDYGGGDRSHRRGRRAGGGVSAVLFPSRGTGGYPEGGAYTNDNGGENLPLPLSDGVTRSNISNSNVGGSSSSSSGPFGNGKRLELGAPRQRQQLPSAGFASDATLSPESDHAGSLSPSFHSRQDQDHQQQLWASPSHRTPGSSTSDPTAPFFLRGSASSAGLSFPPSFNRFGGGQRGGNFLAEFGGSGAKGTGNKVAPSGRPSIPDKPDAEAAPDTWLWDIMLEITENEADRSAWQQEHQQQEELDMELLCASAGATHKLGHGQQQQQQQQRWQNRPAQVSELYFGNIRRTNELSYTPLVTGLAPATPATMHSGDPAVKIGGRSAAASGYTPPVN